VSLIIVKVKFLEADKPYWSVTVTVTVIGVSALTSPAVKVVVAELTFVKEL